MCPSEFLERIVRLGDGETVAAMGVQFGGPTCAYSFLTPTTARERSGFRLPTMELGGWGVRE